MGVLEQSYNEAMTKPLQILEIFNEFFGESRVDMQGFPSLSEIQEVLPENSTVAQIKAYINSKIIVNNRSTAFILVHFPHVRITNEYDRSTDANHLYAKVSFDIDGIINGRFSLNRAEYTTLHFTNGYMHSHISNIPFHNFEEFQVPCTGNGPINNTICSLARDFDPDLWRLFCLELDRFMRVESIAGTPYHRLESLVQGGTRAYTVFNTIRYKNDLTPYEFGDLNSLPIIRSNDRVNPTAILLLANFIKYLIDKEVFKFTYVDNQYTLAMSPTSFYLAIGNAFIKWYNQMFNEHRVANKSELYSSGLLQKVKFSNGVFKADGRGSNNPYLYIGKKICDFKGQPVLLSFSDITVTHDENEITLLAQPICEYIITKILNILNFRYGNKKEGTGSCKNVFFL